MLFQFTPLFEAQIEPGPRMKIVALFYLSPGLLRRVIGATWDQEAHSYHVPEENRQRPISRYEQIAADVAWRKPSAWFALDDDFKEWPGDQYHHLGWYRMMIGFNEPRVQHALQVWLDSL